MKKIFVLLMIVVFAIPMLNSCKKGEEDPFISLRSRESRLKGEWNLTSGDVTITDGTTTTTKTFTGSMMTVTTNGTSATYTHTENLEFLKDNVYKSTKIHDGNPEITDGYWAFMDGYGDEVSDKENVIIRIKSFSSGGSTHTYSDDDMPVNSIHLIKLSNSEIIIGYNGTAVEGSTTTTTSIQKTFEKK